jgi:hypothetical protein
VNKGNGICTLMIMVLLAQVSCSGPKAVDTDPCCLAVSFSRVLDMPPPDIEGLQGGEVLVNQRFDNKAVFATLADAAWDTVYYYSEDGGISWRHDQFYQRLHTQRYHPLREGDILPDNPNPVDQTIQYRQVYRPMGKTINERSTDSGKTWVRMKGVISGSDAEVDRGGTTFYHPRDRLTLYAYSSLPGWNYKGGMFVSVDGGDNFKFMYDSSDTRATLAISQSNPKVMFGAGPMGSLLKSSDGGVSWDFVGQNDYIRKTYIREPPSEKKPEGKSFIKSTTYHAIAIDPENEKRVYVASSKGLLRTEDGGVTWCVLNTGISKADGIHTVAIAPGKPEVILMGTYMGLYRSPDRGCHWERIDVLSRAVKAEGGRTTIK